jgi:serine/threonine-protein kinase
MLSPSEIEGLLHSGKYADAARAHLESGELQKAQALFEKIWDFASAAEVARKRGDRADELRLLLEAKDLPAAARLGETLAASDDGERRRAAEVYEKKRMWAEAARLRERMGQLAEARELYKKGALPLDAARLDEALGRSREAGIAYEEFLAEDERLRKSGATDGESGRADRARAEAALGRILGGFQRHEEAARHLQRALAVVAEGANESPIGLADLCRKQLVVELAALGFTEGARQLWNELRAMDPRIGDGGNAPEPAGLDGFLARFASAARPSTKDEGSLLAGRYQVVRLLGSGGMGRVYLARDRFVAREVAAKVVAPPIDARAREGFARFVREARIVAALKHPHLVSVYDFHEELGLLVMEFMAGGTLAERLRPSLPMGRVKTILSQVVAGLAAAHARGVIHRDIKPANIFFSATGEAKLGDFGVAHLQDLGATQTGGFIGTLAYMSPEQVTGAKLTFACDIYALGVTAFQMLTGRLPFPGPDFVGQHLGSPPPRPSSVNRDLAPFDELVVRMLAKDPAERHGSLDDLARAIAEVELPDPRDEKGAPLPEEAPAAVVSGGEAPRYRTDGEVARSERSVVYRGLDDRLGRAVLIEDLAPEFLAGPDGAAHLRWLRVMARYGGPHLQRVLRIDRSRVVYEAPLGPPCGWVDRPGAGRLVLGICRALAGPHGEGVAHGALAESIVVEETGPTLLVAGRGPRDRSPGDDLVELVDLLRRLGGDAVVAGAPLSDVGALAAWARGLG